MKKKVIVVGHICLDITPVRSMLLIYHRLRKETCLQALELGFSSRLVIKYFRSDTPSVSYDTVPEIFYKSVSDW